MGQKIFLHCPELEQHPYPNTCPFKTSRAGLARARLASMGLLDGPDKIEVPPVPATREELLYFHTPSYLDALASADSGQFEIDMLFMGLGSGDCPVFAGMYPYAVLAAGATITAAKWILDGKAETAFNPSGGYHHAFPDRATGFCYINDVVLGCETLARAGKKVILLDIDVHHCDGVQSAFYTRSDVMTISLHQDGRTLFPGTGFVDEIGTGDGKGFSVNLPLPIGTYDEIYLKAFRQVVLPLIHSFGPDVIVFEAGADTLAGDPLAGLSLTNNVFVEVINQLLAFGKPILAVGGGGYNVENTVRAWALVWSALCGEQSQELSAGLGGVMLENTDLQDGAGLADRAIVADQAVRRSVDPLVERTIEEVKRLIFPLHGL